MQSEVPSEKARKEIMKSVRGRKHLSFFINRETGEIESSAYRSKDSYFSSIPKGTYEVHIESDNPFFSYDDLNGWMEEIMNRVWQEDQDNAEGEKSFYRISRADLMSISRQYMDSMMIR